MNHRHFLQFTLLSAVSAVIPTNLIKQQWPKFDASCEYGVEIPYVGRYSDLNENSLIIKLLHESARKVLPTGEYYELRATIPIRYGRDKKLFWYRGPNMPQRLFKPDKWIIDREGKNWAFISGHLTPLPQEKTARSL